MDRARVLLPLRVHVIDVVRVRATQKVVAGSGHSAHLCGHEGRGHIGESGAGAEQLPGVLQALSGEHHYQNIKI